MIEFIKMLKYDLRNREQDFDWVSRVTLQQEDPKSLCPGGLEQTKEFEVVYHSPLRRVIECLPQKQNDQVYTSISSLSEIKFDLYQFCNEQEFFQHGSQIVRQQFKNFFVRDLLPTSRSYIFREVREVLKLLAEAQALRVAVVSHSFRLSVIEAFITTEAKIEENPNLIHQFIFNDRKRFDFGKGFRADLRKIEKLI
jgi:hypothetical protein